MADLQNYKIVLYRQPDSLWVAYVPAIDGCHAVMETRDAALTELQTVFEMIRDEFAARGQSLPVDRELICA